VTCVRVWVCVNVLCAWVLCCCVRDRASIAIFKTFTMPPCLSLRVVYSIPHIIGLSHGVCNETAFFLFYPCRVPMALSSGRARQGQQGWNGVHYCRVAAMHVDFTTMRDVGRLGLRSNGDSIRALICPYSVPRRFCNEVWLFCILLFWYSLWSGSIVIFGHARASVMCVCVCFWFVFLSWPQRRRRRSEASRALWPKQGPCCAGSQRPGPSRRH
jgi:hypothetical protein